MKFAIIADIHANLEAFQVVLEDIKNQKCTHVACLGDVVGYNANPKECLDMVRSMNIPVVKGNHDEYCSTDEPLDGFNPAAAEADDHQLHHCSCDPRWSAAMGLRL
jgi:predicted phosphodiesterase